MKKLLTLLFILPFIFAACGDDDTKTATQEYTSFQVKNEASMGVLYDVVVGYKQTNGVYMRLAALGDIPSGTYSDKIIINNDSIKEVHIFSNTYNEPNINEGVWLMTKLNITENKNNIFYLKDGFSTGYVVNPKDSTQYPIK